MGTVHLLVNPAESRRVEAYDQVRRLLGARGHQVVEIRPPSAASVATTINQHHADGIDRLIIAGGDGLIHHALPAVAGTGITVGLVSVGTGNDFARALGLPTRLGPAVDAALADPTPIDLIEATPDSAPGPLYAASVVTGGFSGQVNQRANGLRFPSGQQRYTAATLVELPRLTPVELELTIDGVTHHLVTSLFAVANTPYFGGGMAICPDADPTDGILDITVVGPVSRFLLARMLPTVFSGRHVHHPAVQTFRGTEVILATPADLWADGETFPARSIRSASGVLIVAGTLGPT